MKTRGSDTARFRSDGIPRAQELNQTVTVYSVSGPYSAVTGEAATAGAVLVATMWARVKQSAGGGEIEETTQQNSASVRRYDIWMRYWSGLTAWHQIGWNDMTLIQTSPPQRVVDTEGREWWYVQAKQTEEQSA